MGKTYRKDNKFRLKKNGRVFVKDQPWKKNKHKNNSPPEEKPLPEPADYLNQFLN
jgi:hypothetical protein